MYNYSHSVVTMSRRWEHALKWLFLVGAVVDGAATLALVSPQATAILFGRPVHPPDPDLQLASGYAAALMAGWTALLVWAARDPVPRAFVGPLTAIPVLAGLMATEIVALAGGSVASGRVGVMLALQGLALATWFVMYHQVRRRAITGACDGSG